jgi:hypothetical protein
MFVLHRPWLYRAAADAVSTLQPGSAMIRLLVSSSKANSPCSLYTGPCPPNESMSSALLYHRGKPMTVHDTMSPLRHPINSVVKLQMVSSRYPSVAACVVQAPRGATWTSGGAYQAAADGRPAGIRSQPGFRREAVRLVQARDRRQGIDVFTASKAKTTSWLLTFVSLKALRDLPVRPEEVAGIVREWYERHVDPARVVTRPQSR